MGQINRLIPNLAICGLILVVQMYYSTILGNIGIQLILVSTLQVLVGSHLRHMSVSYAITQIQK